MPKTKAQLEQEQKAIEDTEKKVSKLESNLPSMLKKFNELALHDTVLSESENLAFHELGNEIIRKSNHLQSLKIILKTCKIGHVVHVREAKQTRSES